MNYSEFKILVASLKDEYWRNTSNPDKSLINKIYSAWKEVTGEPYRISCNSCYADCLVEMHVMTEQKFNEKATMKNCDFEFKGGGHLCDFSRVIEKDHLKTWVQQNTKTNEKIYWHLCLLRDTIGLEATESHIKKIFQRYPIDWADKIQNYKCSNFPELLPVEIVEEAKEESKSKKKK